MNKGSGKILVVEDQVRTWCVQLIIQTWKLREESLRRS